MNRTELRRAGRRSKHQATPGARNPERRNSNGTTAPRGTRGRTPSARRARDRLVGTYTEPAPARECRSECRIESCIIFTGRIRHRTLTTGVARSALSLLMNYIVRNQMARLPFSVPAAAVPRSPRSIRRLIAPVVVAPVPAGPNSLLTPASDRPSFARGPARVPAPRRPAAPARRRATP